MMKNLEVVEDPFEVEQEECLAEHCEDYFDNIQDNFINKEKPMLNYNNININWKKQKQEN